MSHPRTAPAPTAGPRLTAATTVRQPVSPIVDGAQATVAPLSGAPTASQAPDHASPGAAGPAAAAIPPNWTHVQAAQNGDLDAFGILYGEYAHVVYRYVLCRVSDHCLAEDITSETFLRALRRIASVSYQGRDLAAWFVTIARNLILDHAKSSRNRLEVLISDLADSASAQAKSHQTGPEQHVLVETTHTELLRCIQQLNPEQRECIELRFVHGLSVNETATRMGRNEGAVKALQHRAVRRLAQLLPEDIR